MFFSFLGLGGDWKVVIILVSAQFMPLVVNLFLLADEKHVKISVFYCMLLKFPIIFHMFFF